MLSQGLSQVMRRYHILTLVLFLRDIITRNAMQAMLYKTPPKKTQTYPARSLIYHG